MKIWQQSLAVIAKLPTYEAALDEHARQVCSAGTEVHLHGIDPDSYAGETTPIQILLYPWTFRLATIQIVENGLRAQREGYDVFCLSTFCDPGIDELRSMLDIPVATIFETSLLMADLTAKAPALFALNRDHVQMVRAMLARKPLGAQVAGVYPMPKPITEPDMRDERIGAVIAEFETAARDAIAAGADLLIPAEGLLNTLLRRGGVTEVDGVPVQDSYGATLCFAEMLDHLRRTSGIPISRTKSLGRADEAGVAHLRAAAARALTR